jgi:hypothetical protein
MDRWNRPDDMLPGITFGFMIVIPWTQLLRWPEEHQPGTCRLMMEADTALAIDILLLRPTEQPITMRIPNSVIFARLDLGNDKEAVLVSRKLPWTEADADTLEAMKALARSSAGAYVDPRPSPNSAAPGMRHVTRLTHFGTTDTGLRYVVDTYEDRPFS